MLASGSTRAPNALTAFEQALAKAHYPFEVAEIDGSGSLEWSMETHNFGLLPISRGRSDLSYRGRRRRDERGADHFVLHMTEWGSVRFSQPDNSITTNAGAV